MRNALERECDALSRVWDGTQNKSRDQSEKSGYGRASQPHARGDAQPARRACRACHRAVGWRGRRLFRSVNRRDRHGARHTDS